MAGSKTGEVLYHYTSQRNLRHIVEGRRLWVSNVYYMNDANEIKYGAELFKELVAARRLVEQSISLREFLGELHEWTNQLIGLPHYLFVFSLTERGNLLSQWRAYTPQGGIGVSIGFGKDQLDGLARARGFDLIKCVYVKEQQSEILTGQRESILTQFLEDSSTLQTAGRPEGQKYLPYLYRHSESLLRVFCRLKDPFFEEEREWRLVSPYYETYTDPTIRFRDGAASLIPFIEFDLNGIREDGHLFEEVYVGPAPHFTLAYAAICSFLSNKSACNVIINSRSPLRSM